MAALAAHEEQRAGSAAVLPAGKVQQARAALVEELATFPGEHLVPVSVVLGPFVPRPMGLLSVVPQSLEPPREVCSIWRNPVGGGQVEAEALLIPVPQQW